MRILIGSDLFYPILYTGGEVHSFNVARWMVKLGHEVTVIAARTAFYQADIATLKEQEIVEGINIIRTKTPYHFGSSISSIASMKEMYSLAKEQIQKNNIDIVCPVKPRTYLPLFLAARNKVVCAALIHDFYPYQSLGLASWGLQELTLRLPYNHVLTVSESVKLRLKKYYPENKLSVIYNGIDLEKIDSIKADHKKPSQLIFIGNLYPYKNTLDAIKAVELARQDIPDLELLIVSHGGSEEDHVRNAIQGKNYIKYLGNVSDMVKYKMIKESSLLLLPSSAEGFGLVLIEALGCRTSFISYDIPAVKEVCELTRGGTLVPHRDISALAKTIIDLLKNPSHCKSLAETGRSKVETLFTWEKVAEREVSILNKLIS